MREFLSSKIKQLNRKLAPGESEIIDFNLLDQKPAKISSYRVNRLGEIQSIRVNGDSKRVEELFNDRVAKTDANFLFKNAMLTHEKKQSKQLASTVNRFHEVCQQMLSYKTAYHTGDTVTS